MESEQTGAGTFDSNWFEVAQEIDRTASELSVYLAQLRERARMAYVRAGIRSTEDRAKVDRILWNTRPNGSAERGCIDEIVLHDVAVVHVEQMDDRCWWIGITTDEARYWSGHFIADSRGRMRFTEQDNDGITWDRDDSHER